VASKMALDIMIELYKKNVWNDAKTVNVIASACYKNNEGKIEVTKLTAMGLRFFLGSDEDDEKDSDDEDELPSIKDVKMANKVNKKTRKREKMLANVKKAHKKTKKSKKAESYNFSALHLVHDPQKFAEDLFKAWRDSREKFEINMLIADLISRLIGTHQLFVLNYYKKIADYLRPHQREVINLLQFAAQASHELIPHDDIQPVVSAIANNFITERNNGEVIAIGLNAMREICKRCPFALDETLLRDLAEYKSYKDKGVMMAARSLISLYRTTQPELLHKKDRGRPTEAAVENSDGNQRKYGEIEAKDFIPGAEVVENPAIEAEPTKENLRKRKRVDSEDEDSEEESDWEDVVHTSDEDNEDEDNGTSLEERKAKAAEVTTSRFLTDADFKRIEAAQLRKQVQGFSKGKNKKRRLDEDNPLMKSSKAREELVDLANIEMIHKKRRHDKESRLATIMEGRKDREKFGSKRGKANEHASTTHKEKNKKKNFMMMKHKLKFKAKRSFVEKQAQLRKSMLRSRKFK
jgi:protein SDA1